MFRAFSLPSSRSWLLMVIVSTLAAEIKTEK
jgi:hypothetical protein